ncbi:hypothetical protein [Aquimarina algiphila]|uniref:Uncharacterized protein n=1 Tax=Aquimarina algiphila TaxID=2047982 RepID=A0A554VJE6_9FLAO|nr:hypothetical protein [Aquimarina algiphila]TSE07989.1 hypothetical protein FOF46_13895 [Aquimarina algiphila]
MILPVLLALTAIAFVVYVIKHPPTNCSTNSNSICEDYSDKIVSKLRLDLIHTMVKGYRNNQLQSILRDIGDDAHSIWFDLETLKKFIYHIEHHTEKSKKLLSKEDQMRIGKLGVRIYYSCYPSEISNGLYPDLNVLPTNYNKRHTLIMLPTMLRDNIHMDFNPIDEKSFTLSKEKLKTYFASNSGSSIPALGIFESSSNNRSTISQNHGGLIPPADGSGEAI